MTVTVYSASSAPVAAKLGILTQPSTTQVQGVALTTQPIVEVRDAGGAKVTGSTATVVATITAQSAIGGTLSGTVSVNAVAGVATFTDLKIDNVDTYTITFSSTVPATLTPATSNVFTNGAISAFIAAAGGTTVFDYFYHSAFNVVTSGGNLVTRDDVRGSSFAPTQVPTGTVAVSGGTINTNGTNNYFGNASNDPKFRFDQSTRTRFVCGEMTSGDYDGGWQTGGAFELLHGSASLLSVYGTNSASAKVQPGGGVRSCWVFGVWKQSFESTARMWFEWIGRGVNPNSTSVSTTSARLLWGCAPAGSNFKIVKERHSIGLNIAETAAIRAAYETMVQDANLGDSPSLYAASDSQGQCGILGDSIAAGSSGGVTASITTPLDTSKTFLPAYIQAALNAASKKIDCYVVATGGYTLAQLLSDGAFDRACAHMSPARRAAGFKDFLYSEAGTNDLSAGTTAVTIEGYLTTLVNMVHAAGGKIILQTIIPRGGFYLTAKETERLALNTWIRANSVGADAVSDPTTNAHFADPSGGTDTITTDTGFYADGIHPNPGGTAVIGPIVGAAVVSIA